MFLTTVFVIRQPPECSCLLSDHLTNLHSHLISICFLFTIVAVSLKQPSEVVAEVLAVMIQRVIKL